MLAEEGQAWFARAVPLPPLCLPLSWTGRGPCELGPSTLCGIPGAVAAWDPTGPQLKVQSRHPGGISPLALGEMNHPQLSSAKL